MQKGLLQEGLPQNGLPQKGHTQKGPLQKRRPFVKKKTLIFLYLHFCFQNLIFDKI